MEIKSKITSDFNKDDFIIEPMGVEGGIDPFIKNFIIKLNESKDICTIYSCEGHGLDDNSLGKCKENFSK